MLSKISIMTIPKAVDFTGEVAIVTGAGSRLDGKLILANSSF